MQPYPHVHSGPSPVPRLALEAVLFRSTEERSEVEKGIDSLIQYSMAEVVVGTQDKQVFITLPLVAYIFGKKKLNISPSKISIQADVEILQMLGPSKRDDIHLGLARKLERYLANLSMRASSSSNDSAYLDIIQAICRAYNPGWLILARWHMEQESQESYIKAIAELRSFLENEPPPEKAIIAWRMLGQACFKVGDMLGEIHALIECARFPEISFNEISQTASWTNKYLHESGAALEKEERREIASAILAILESRKSEAGPVDFSRMAWLAINSGQDSRAMEYVRLGREIDMWNSHLISLAERLGIC
jgi:hypothetical protein